jgi:hypothetical protein
MEELKNIAPTLANRAKKVHFDVPEDYFELLPHQIQERCASKQSTKKQFFAANKFRVSIFASIGILMVLYFAFSVQKQKTPDVSTEEISHYISQNMEEEFDEELLMEAISTEKLNSTSKMEEYLMEGDIDEELLTNELL